MRIRAGLLFSVLLSGCGLLLADHPINRGDPRFAECGGNAGEVLAAFPMVAANYKRHFPKMGLSPELGVDEPAFAVAFNERARGPATLGGPLLQGVNERELAEPKPHWVRVYVGTPPTGIPNWYAEVNLEGMNP